MGIGLGAIFGAINPVGAATSLGGALIGGGAEFVGGGQFFGRGFQAGGLAGGLIGAGIDDYYRVLSKAIGPNAGRVAFSHASRQTGVAFALAGGVGYGTYHHTGSLDHALLAANLASVPSNLIARALVPCFPAGTPIRVADGEKPIEDIRPGDIVLSRDEHDVDGPVELKQVEEVFVREGRILKLSVGDQVIRATKEHPFFVEGNGWTAAGELTEGDLLSTETGEWIELQGVSETDEIAVVYNFRVADHHTYFVGSTDWQFSVWAHNRCNTKLRANLGLRPGDSDYAAHVVPVGEFAKRSSAVRTSIQDAKDVLARNDIDIDSWYNGFRSSNRRHFGTHTDEFLGQLGDRLLQAERNLGRFGVLDELNNLKLEALSGAF